jgi:uncharacterized membrane protein YdjX (TVP38/TMEM64 family)
MSTQKTLHVFFIAISLFAVYPFQGQLVSLMHWFKDPQAVSTAIQQSGFWGPTLLFVLFVLQVFLAFIPGQALMVASGYIYGFTGGMLITWFSLVTGGQAAFWLARRYGRRFTEKWVSSSVLDRWNRNATSQSIGFFAITLVLPLFPNDAKCYVAGLGKISSRRFMVANILGRGMASFIMVVIGAYGSMISTQVWLGAAVLVVLITVGWQIARRLNSSYMFV